MVSGSRGKLLVLKTSLQFIIPIVPQCRRCRDCQQPIGLELVGDGGRTDDGDSGRGDFDGEESMVVMMLMFQMTVRRGTGTLLIKPK